MDKKQQIRELQEKAFNGDTEAIDLYNEYVNKGEAPAIRIPNQKGSETLEMYKEEAKGGRTSLFGNLDPTKLHEVSRTPYTLMASGYEARKEEAKNKVGDVTNFAGEKVDTSLSPLEKMNLAYNPNGTAKNKEIIVNPNDIKED